MVSQFSVSNIALINFVVRKVYRIWFFIKFGPKCLLSIFVCSLKCIWNEIFDNNFIVLLESVLKDKINAIYHLLITCLDPELWRSEILKLKWKNGKKSSKNQ